MSVSKHITDFAAHMEQTREKMYEKRSAIAALESKRRTIEQAPPHTDDIVAVFKRGLDHATAEFERQLKDRLHEDFVKTVGGSAAMNAAETSRINVLTMPREKPDADTIRRYNMGKEERPLNAAALTYFMRGKIADELPSLIAKLCPQAAEGTRAADRRAAIAEVDAEIATLKAELKEVEAEIGAAQTAVRWNG